VFLLPFFEEGAVVGGGFDELGAGGFPAGGGEFADDVESDGSDGAEEGDEIVEEFVEGAAVFVAVHGGVGLSEVTESGGAAAVFEGVGAGAVLAFGHDGPFGFGAVVAGNLGFLFLGHIDPFCK